MSMPARRSAPNPAALLGALRPLPTASWVLLGAVAVSLSWTGWSASGARELLQMGLLLGIAVWVGRWLGPRQRQWFGTALAAGFAANLLIAGNQLLNPHGMAPVLAAMHGPAGTGFWGPDLSEELCTGLWSSHRLYAAFMVVAFPFVPLAMRNRAALFRWSASGLALFLLAQTLFHSGFLLLLAGTCLLFLHSLPPTRGQLRRRLAMAAVVALVSGSGFRLFGPQPAPSATAALHTFHVAADSAAEPTRLAIERAAALRDMAAHPFGRGPGNYRNAIRRARIEALLPPPREDRVPRDSNSQFLVLAVESGPVAACAFALLLAGACLTALRRAWTVPTVETSQRAAEASSLAALAASALLTLSLSRSLGLLTGLMIGIGLGPALPVPAWKRFGGLTLQGAAVVLAAVLAVALRPLALPSPVTTAASTHVPFSVHDGDRTIPAFFVEAEAADSLPANFIVRDTHDTGSNRVLTIPAESGKGIGAATYRLDVPAAGDYKLWIRANWEGGCANSVNCQLDQGPILTVEDGLFHRWHWVDVAARHTLALPAGPVTFRLINSEDGVHIDQIAFVANSATVPAGILTTTPAASHEPLPEAAEPTPAPLPFGDDLPETDAFDKY